MRVLIIEPNKTPYESTIGGDLESMQKVVGGLIELVDLDKSTALVCNEEGKCIGLKGNRRVGRDIIAGTFFICGYDNEWEFCSLTDEQVQKYTERFKEDEQYTIEEIKDNIFIEVYTSDSFQGQDDEEMEVEL